MFFDEMINKELHIKITKRTLLVGLSVLCLGTIFSSILSGCSSDNPNIALPDYNVILLGDLHFDGISPTIYHKDFQNVDGRYNQEQRGEIERYAEMWADRCPRLVDRAAQNADDKTNFVLQLGDLIQGDCMDEDLHTSMLDDAMNYLKKKFTSLPILTVAGNHDIRGHSLYKNYGSKAYSNYMNNRLSNELNKKITSNNFSVWVNKDIWIFVDFNKPDFNQIKKLLDESANARHTFFVSHGSVFPYDSQNCRWFLFGEKEQDEQRIELRNMLSKRHAIVLCGHTHRLEYAYWQDDSGSITQLTVNSVWSSDKLAKPRFESTSPHEYGTLRNKQAENQGDLQADVELLEGYRSSLKEYKHAKAAGSFKLHIGENNVTADFYGGDSNFSEFSWELKKS